MSRNNRKFNFSSSVVLSANSCIYAISCGKNIENQIVSWTIKASDQIREKLESEDNDLKALGLGTKLIKEERKERFEENWLPLIKELCDVQHDSACGRYTFELEGEGVVDFYPKANKLLIRKKNRWVKPALKWLIWYMDLQDLKNNETP